MYAIGVDGVGDGDARAGSSLVILAANFALMAYVAVLDRRGRSS